MSLVKMRKFYFVGPLEKRDSTVAKLEELGVLHVQDLAEQVPEPPAELVAEAARAQRAVDLLRRVHAGMKTPPDTREKGEIAELLGAYEQTLQKKNQWEQELSQLEKEFRALEPWGAFEPEDVRLLEDHGVFVRFYLTSEKALAKEAAFLQNAFWHRAVELQGAHNRGVTAIFAGTPPEDAPFDRMPLPTRSLRELEKAIAKHKEGVARAQEKLEELSAYLPVFERHLREVQSRLARARVTAGLLEDGPVFAVAGFAPAAREKDIFAAFSGTTTAVVAEDPAPDDDVPIAFSNGPLVRPFEVLIKMFNLPHYREPDPTILVAPFMGAFFGFCFGDGAYGLLLFLLATFLASRFKNNASMLPFFRLLQILGVFTLVIGLMLGSVFGVSLPNLKALQSIQSAFLLRTYSQKPTEFFYFALKIGVFQVMVGYIIKLVLSIGRRQFQTALCTLGWMTILVFGYFMISKWTLAPRYLVPALAGVGIMFVFSDTSSSIAKRLGAGAWGIYNVAGLFGDVMSYARIFGLGLSSAIIASVVNEMAMTLLGPRPGLGWIFAPILLIFGHTFNFAMSIIGSLVHSARLNFLEYYGKFFEGGGKEYAPFGQIK